jgi:hypothetical protein
LWKTWRGGGWRPFDMARWKPPADGKFEGNERIGRRLFELIPLNGASGQKPAVGLAWQHFEESRDAGDVSMDRLGRGCVDKKVKTYLVPRCASAATKFKPVKKFRAWAVVGVSELRRPAHGPALTLLASPVPLAPPSEEGIVDPLSDNDYHAHVERAAGYSSAYDMANHLRNIFESKLQIETVGGPAPAPAPVPAPAPAPAPAPTSWRARFKTWIANLFIRS